jgi:hypothetical protein
LMVEQAMPMLSQVVGESLLLFASAALLIG